MRIAVCDDDRLFLRIVEVQVHNYFNRLGMKVSLELFGNADEFWARFEADPFNIVILDIIMPAQSGIELSRAIYRRNRRCVIAFLTSSPDYAREGYGVNAVGYLLKPASQGEMDELLAKCVERYNETRPSIVFFKCGGVTHKLDADSIVYLESQNKQIHVHCENRVLVCSGKLSDALAQLPAGFVQTHKSYVVNLLHVSALGKDEMLTYGDARIPISRQHYKDAVKSYYAYQSEQE